MKFIRFMKYVKSNVVNLNYSVEMCSHKRNTIARDKNDSSTDIIILLRFPSFHGKLEAVKLRKLPLAIVALGYHAYIREFFNQILIKTALIYSCFIQSYSGWTSQE